MAEAYRAVEHLSTSELQADAAPTPQREPAPVRASVQKLLAAYALKRAKLNNK